MRTLCILVTGDPVAATLEQRGDFSVLMREVVGREWSEQWLVVDCRQQAPLPPPATLAGLIITGSPESVTSRADWILRAEEYLRQVVQTSLPTLGVCFGHQLLAQALGGRVEQNPRGREMGTVELSLLEEDPVLSDGRRPYQVNMSHVDSVVELPAEALVLGRTELDPHAAVRFNRTTWGVQFHPEFDGQIIGQYASARAEALRDEGLDAAQVAGAATDALPGAGVLPRFVRELERSLGG